MRNIIEKTLGFLIGAALLHGCQHANAQSVFNKYGPVAGIQKSTGSTYQNTAAASSDVVSLWSGTCDASHFLAGNGTCAVPAGTGVTSVGLTVPFSWESVSGSPVTSSGTLAINAVSGLTANQFVGTPNGSTGTVSLRALVGADLPPINLGSTANGGVLSSSILLGTNGGTSNGFFSVTGPATSLKTFTFPNASATVLTSNAAVTVAQGGTGVGTLTAHGVLLGEGTGNVSAVAAMAADTLLQGQGTTTDPAAVSVNNCGSSTQALSYSTSTHTFGCQTISVGTGSVTSLTSGTAIVLSPSTITTTGSISLDTTASPTITGTWTFGTAPGFTNGFTIGSGGNTNGAIAGNISNSNTGTAALTQFSAAATGDGPVLGATGSGYTGTLFTGAPSGEFSYLIASSSTSHPFSIATGNVERLRITGAGAISGYGATAAGTVDMTPDTATATGTVTGCTTAPTTTVRLVRSGNLAMVHVDSFSCTSNSTALTLTGAIPSEWQPARTQNPAVVVGDNGASTFGVASVTSGSSTLSFFAGSTGNFTASGTKGSSGNAIVISYPLN